jgi:hypothetical protein
MRRLCDCDGFCCDVGEEFRQEFPVKSRHCTLAIFGTRLIES